MVARNLRRHHQRKGADRKPQRELHSGGITSRNIEELRRLPVGKTDIDGRKDQGVVRNFRESLSGWHMNYRDVIAIEEGERDGRPCVRGLRIAVYYVLGCLAAGLSHEQIRIDYPELTESDIRACLAYAADPERRLITAVR